MLTEIQQHHSTPEEYLELEEKADTKNEYIDGKIISMVEGLIGGKTGICKNYFYKNENIF